MGMTKSNIGDVAIGNIANAIERKTTASSEIAVGGAEMRMMAEAVKAWGDASEAIGIAIGNRFKYKEAMIKKQAEIAKEKKAYEDNFRKDHIGEKPNTGDILDFNLQMMRYDKKMARYNYWN